MVSTCMSSCACPLASYFCLKKYQKKYPRSETKSCPYPRPGKPYPIPTTGRGVGDMEQQAQVRGGPQREEASMARRGDSVRRRWRRARRRPEHGDHARGWREAAVAAPSSPIPSPNPVRPSHDSSSPSSPIPSHISPQSPSPISPPIHASGGSQPL
jgi:hypothetical protein